MDEIYPKNISRATSLLESRVLTEKGTPPSPVLLVSDQGQEGVLVSLPAFTGSGSPWRGHHSHLFRLCGRKRSQVLWGCGEGCGGWFQCSSHFMAWSCPSLMCPPSPPSCRQMCTGAEGLERLKGGHAEITGVGPYGREYDHLFFKKK